MYELGLNVGDKQRHRLFFFTCYSLSNPMTAGPLPPVNKMMQIHAVIYIKGAVNTKPPGGAPVSEASSA